MTLSATPHWYLKMFKSHLLIYAFCSAIDAAPKKVKRNLRSRKLTPALEVQMVCDQNNSTGLALANNLEHLKVLI